MTFCLTVCFLRTCFICWWRSETFLIVYFARKQATIREQRCMIGYIYIYLYIYTLYVYLMLLSIGSFACTLPENWSKLSLLSQSYSNDNFQLMFTWNVSPFNEGEKKMLCNISCLRYKTLYEMSRFQLSFAEVENNTSQKNSCEREKKMLSSFNIKKRSWYTKIAPKVMPPVYFRGSYKKYRVQNNTIGNMIYKSVHFEYWIKLQIRLPGNDMKLSWHKL